MYIHTLLPILTISLTVVECGSWWDILTNIITYPTTPEDAQLDIGQLAYKYGYNLEEHKVITDDAYVINFHRIPSDKNGKKNGTIVFLMHGIIECSDSWLLQGPNYSLAYVLADEGFDVWMGNARGNKHSVEHRLLNKTSPGYWKFSWEEIGLYDLPAMIDYILQTTGKESLYYVGHSQGTTSGYVMLSLKPEYNAKINIMFSLAPEAWMGNVKSPIIRMFSPAAEEIASLIDSSVFSSGTDMFNRISSFVCHWFSYSCDNILHSLIGPHNYINESLWPVILGHMPTGASTLQLIHYGQLVNSGRFCRFDHGLESNKKIYGQDLPPAYNLSNIVAPVILFYSENDWLSDPHDVDILKSQLPNVKDTICFRDFGHMDYVYGTEANDAIYIRIISQINKFEAKISKMKLKNSTLNL